MVKSLKWLKVLPYTKLFHEDLLERLYSDGSISKGECQHLESFDRRVDYADFSVGVG